MIDKGNEEIIPKTGSLVKNSLEINLMKTSLMNISNKGKWC